MRSLLGVCWFLANVPMVTLLRPRDGHERAIVRFPGAWITVGLLLTSSFAGALALMASGFAILRGSNGTKA